MSEIYDRITRRWKDLRDQWAATRQKWRDTVGDRFEREFWQEWEKVVPQFLKAVDDLEKVLDRAVRDTQRERW